jgi:hypothetical protein
MFHQNLRSKLFTGFLSQVLESAVFPTQVDLFLQRNDSVGQLMGGHTNSCQALLFQVDGFVGQSYYLREFEGVGSSLQVPWNSESLPTKGGRLGSWFSE